MNAKSISLRIIAAAAFVLLAVPSMRSAEPDRDAFNLRLTRLEQKAQQLKADGRGEEANKIMDQVEDLRRQAMASETRRPGSKDSLATADLRRAELNKLRDEVKTTRARAEDMRQGGDQAMASELERRADDMSRPLDESERAPMPPGMDSEREHLRIAVEHLHAAGRHDLARRLAMEMSQPQPRREGAGEPRFGIEGGRAMGAPPRGDLGPDRRPNDEVGELRREVGELRRAVDDLHRHLDEARHEKR